MKRSVINITKNGTGTIILILIIGLLIRAYGQEKGFNYNQKKFGAYTERLSHHYGITFNAYQGDIAKFLEPSKQNYYLNPGLTYGLSYRLIDRISLRADIGTFILHAETEETTLGYSNFTSINLEYYFTVMIDLLPKYISDGMEKRWDAHILGGIGHVVFFPFGKEYTGVLTGKIIQNGDIGDYDFSKLSAQYPVGLGVKYYINKDNHIAVEGLYHFTKTNFIDATRDLENDIFDKYISLSIKFVKVIDLNPNKTFNYKSYLKRNRKLGDR